MRISTGVLLVSVSGLLLLTGCFATYKVDKPLPVLIESSGARVAIVVPADGQDRRPATYKGSGQQTADALKTVLERRGMIANTGFGLPTPRPGLQPGAPSGVQPGGMSRSGIGRSLRITPTIENWEDRVTEWSGIPDKLQIRLVVTDAINGKTLDDRVVTASSKWYTYGGDHPQEMLEDLFAKWADAVFTKATK